MWTPRPLQSSYDVVIIGAGIHGLATAYYLGKLHGVKKIALLDRGYLGGGNSGRNTAILRSNYRTQEGIPFYDASVKLYEQMSQELGWNVMFSQYGHLTTAHTDSSVVGLRVRAENNQVLGVDSRIIYPAEIKKLVPAMDVSSKARFPILAALYHPPGGVIRHDAVVWGYARACDRMNIEIHPYTEVTGIRVENGRALSVATTRGDVAAGAVVNITAGWASTISKMAGVPLPIVSHQLQACVTEPLKPFLDKVIVSATLHVYVNQTDKGELVLGAEIDPYQSYSMRSTLPTLEQIAGHTLDLFPQLHGVRILRQWAGVCDMTPDYAPIIGRAEEVENFYMDVGWGTYGFKAGPIAGKCTAELIATGKTPALIEGFSPGRFRAGKLIGEKAAAAVSS
ncbi:MAG TPA: FAD-dependent oxidoreductase [Bryobacteraceae bacterium]|nr:FAD-dependent oxidoreductase [Bryobacteraceae bacterium]